MADEGNPRQRVLAGFKTWFFTPPRPHGEIIHTREVSFLELFYDLVYVVLIAEVSHHLATHIGWAGLWDFVVVFGLVWMAWFNGTMWHELHSREDGRSRNFIFLQMMLLALLAVFAGHATDDDGPAFAITFAILFALYTWQWYLVQRVDDPSYRPVTVRYLTAMLVTVAAMVMSAFVPEGVRMGIWAALIAGWLISAVTGARNDDQQALAGSVTASLVERYGLFTIIVLGEVVVGVVAGISDLEELTPRAIATGIIALTIGFGLWWNYFDTLGRRIPDGDNRRFIGWLLAHLPLAGAIAAGGAAMVSLVEHAADGRTPAGTAWLLTGSVTVALIGITIAARALPVDEFPKGMVRQLAPTYGIAAVCVLVVGALRPAPIVLASLVSVLLALTWLRLFALYLALGGKLRVTPEAHAEEN